MEELGVSNEAVIDVRRVSKSFERGTRVLDDVSFSVGCREMVALIGASGSGKSTLIRALAGLVAVDKTPAAQARAGTIAIFGRPIQRDGRIARGAKELRVRVGVIFQQFNLVPRLSVLTNVCLGLPGRMPFLRGTLSNFTLNEKRAAMHALARVGMTEHALKRGSELSGGQQQRAAIARTLVQGAELLIADEPIASLDPASARRVMDILADMNRKDGITILVSLHQVIRADLLPARDRAESGQDRLRRTLRPTHASAVEPHLRRGVQRVFSAEFRSAGFSLASARERTGPALERVTAWGNPSLLQRTSP